MVTTVTNNSPQEINTSLFSLQKQIDELNRIIIEEKHKNSELEERIKKLEDKH